MSRKHIGIEEARKTLGDIISEVQYTGTDIILTRKGKPAARIAALGPARSYIAEIGISPRTSINGYCGVTVTPDQPLPGKGMDNIDTAISAEAARDLDRNDVLEAAEDILTANGWTVDGDWVDGDDSYYAPVRPA